MDLNEEDFFPTISPEIYELQVMVDSNMVGYLLCSLLQFKAKYIVFA